MARYKWIGEGPVILGVQDVDGRTPYLEPNDVVELPFAFADDERPEFLVPVDEPSTPAVKKIATPDPVPDVSGKDI